MLLQGMLGRNGRLINEQLLLAARGMIPGAVLAARAGFRKRVEAAQHWGWRRVGMNLLLYQQCSWCCKELSCPEQLSQIAAGHWGKGRMVDALLFGGVNGSQWGRFSGALAPLSPTCSHVRGVPTCDGAAERRARGFTQAHLGSLQTDGYRTSPVVPKAMEAQCWGSHELPALQGKSSRIGVGGNRAEMTNGFNSSADTNRRG